ncbi:hypothetical protein MSAN_02014600 [Mycena sanguinolenta]|uniref:Cytochrome P450 n=1 Tax=Mycena sanguinolenta TaxID=230812 RepID=A0A8H7CLX4_9AGAR|nr:hypothetical protein MSAN_02014600 [Mycena sanguinolenta]
MTYLQDDSHLTLRWAEQFGRTFLFHGLFSTTELHTTDIKAITHVVSRPDIYQKSTAMRASTEIIIGRGVLSVENEEHKRHVNRRALNPAFGVTQVRAVTEIFLEKAVQLRDAWADISTQAVVIGFNYQFESLNGKCNDLDDALTDLLHSPHSIRYSAFRLAQGIVPILQFLPGPGQNLFRAARNKMFGIGKQIVNRSKADIRASKGERALGKSRDLLSTLLKANMSTNIPESQRLNDIEIVAEISTFLFAGHETTSLATTWALHALSRHLGAQRKLREELLTIPTDNPTMEELNSLPYLEAVVREVLRVHSPVVNTQRMAMQDDTLPLATPYIDKEGNLHDSLPIPKGQRIYIPISAINTDKEIWGEDAREFRPERWEKIPSSASAIPGVWANLLTFFAGPHNCIGFRFALVEMKALLFTLIRAFEFEEAAKSGIRSFTVGLLQKPAVIGEARSSGLPLIVKLKPYNIQI